MPVLSRLSATALISGTLLVTAGAAWAGLGQPTPWQMDLQDSATPVMADVASFHFFLLWVIAAISAFVLALLLICIVRFNARANPTPSRTTHNTPIEILWTIVPVIILAAIAVPSFGIRMDAVPGRINETWFKATIEGVFYGQCSELCGKDHAFMPIAVRVVNDGEFNNWLNGAKQKYAIDNAAAPNALAATATPAIR